MPNLLLLKFSRVFALSQPAHGTLQTCVNLHDSALIVKVRFLSQAFKEKIQDIADKTNHASAFFLPDHQWESNSEIQASPLVLILELHDSTSYNGKEPLASATLLIKETKQVRHKLQLGPTISLRVRTEIRDMAQMRLSGHNVAANEAIQQFIQRSISWLEKMSPLFAQRQNTEVFDITNCTTWDALDVELRAAMSRPNLTQNTTFIAYMYRVVAQAEAGWVLDAHETLEHAQCFVTARQDRITNVFKSFAMGVLYSHEQRTIRAIKKLHEFEIDLKSLEMDGPFAMEWRLVQKWMQELNISNHKVTPCNGTAEVPQYNTHPQYTHIDLTKLFVRALLRKKCTMKRCDIHMVVDAYVDIIQKNPHFVSSGQIESRIAAAVDGLPLRLHPSGLRVCLAQDFLPHMNVEKPIGELFQGIIGVQDMKHFVRLVRTRVQETVLEGLNPVLVLFLPNPPPPCHSHSSPNEELNYYDHLQQFVPHAMSGTSKCSNEQACEDIIQPVEGKCEKDNVYICITIHNNESYPVLLKRVLCEGIIPPHYKEECVILAPTSQAVYKLQYNSGWNAYKYVDEKEGELLFRNISMFINEGHIVIDTSLKDPNEYPEYKCPAEDALVKQVPWVSVGVLAFVFSMVIFVLLNQKKRTDAANSCGDDDICAQIKTEVMSHSAVGVFALICGFGALVFCVYRWFKRRKYVSCDKCVNERKWIWTTPQSGYEQFFCTLFGECECRNVMEENMCSLYAKDNADSGVSWRRDLAQLDTPNGACSCCTQPPQDEPFMNKVKHYFNITDEKPKKCLDCSSDQCRQCARQHDKLTWNDFVKQFQGMHKNLHAQLVQVKGQEEPFITALEFDDNTEQWMPTPDAITTSMDDITALKPTVVFLRKDKKLYLFQETYDKVVFAWDILV